jgi:hypothetical protein
MADITKPDDSATGTVDWEGAQLPSSVATPPAEGEGTPIPFEPRSFKYGSRSLTAHSVEEAEAIEELIRENRREGGRWGAENAALKERLARLEGTVEASRSTTPTGMPDIKPPSIELARTDPERWYADDLAYRAAMAAQLKMEIEDGVRQQLTAKEQQAAQEAASKSWGDAFYARHSHLDNPHRRTIVQSVYRQHMEEIAGFGADIAGAHDRLAELTEAAITEIAGTGGRGKSTTRPPRLEGPSSRPVSRMVEPERPAMTGADWIAQERKRMRG